MVLKMSVYQKLWMKRCELVFVPRFLVRFVIFWFDIFQSSLEQALSLQRTKHEEEIESLRQELHRSQESQREARVLIGKQKPDPDATNDRALLDRIAALETQMRDRTAAEKLARTKDAEKIDSQSAEVTSPPRFVQIKRDNSSSRVFCFFSDRSIAW